MFSNFPSFLAFWQYYVNQSFLVAKTTFWIMSWMLIVNVVSLHKEQDEATGWSASYFQVSTKLSTHTYLHGFLSLSSSGPTELTTFQHFWIQGKHSPFWLSTAWFNDCTADLQKKKKQTQTAAFVHLTQHRSLSAHVTLQECSPQDFKDISVTCL